MLQSGPRPEPRLRGALDPRPADPRRPCLAPLVAVGACGLWLAAAPLGAARAGDDKPGEPPLLDAPLLAPPLATPLSPPSPAPSTPTAPPPAAAAQAVPPPTAPAVPARPAAVLAIPGMIRPTAVPRSAAAAPSVAPDLVAPVVEANSGDAGLPSALPGAAEIERIIVSRPLGADSASEPSLEGPSLGTRDTPEPIADPFPLRTPPSSSASGRPTPRIEPTPRTGRDSGPASATASPPRRRLFGLLPPSPSAVRSYASQRPAAAERSTAATAAAALATKERDAEAAAQETLRRRIEKQARLAAGDRAQVVEAQLDKTHATVRASGVRFYQKRAVRRSLETLPALAGLHSTIEVLD